MSYPALTTTFAAPPGCNMWHLENCGILPDHTTDGVEQSACTGEAFPTQSCGEPVANCFPSTDADGDPVLTYAGTICPSGMEAVETGSDSTFCCPSGLQRFGSSFCTGSASSGTFVVERTDDAGECQVTSTVTFGPTTTGNFEYIYSTFDSSVTLPYPLDRMAMEITAQGIQLMGGAAAPPTPTEPPSTTSEEPTTEPTEEPTGYPTDEPTDEPSTTDEEPTGDEPPTVVPTGSEYPTSSAPPTGTTPGGGEQTPSGTPPPEGAAARLDTRLTTTFGGVLFAALGYLILQ